ncbi:AAA family ATPase [Aquisalinus flavus]|uniref:ATPase n=1 Tax=Aquisalinus flavus TaxID=1526572 RepID=A0A8J2V1P5_9PROT|nr:AAA family ATPase [Aquisalinus flavus]MBD0426160.1 AAA family ATPase [Aquisalinus flavus]UNE48262.1 AAA family ATPase [Aquisalinus flavus]GGD10118.1 ATPase [Aquisalinus flavus]
MRIKQITVKNYKALQDVTLKDIPGFAVILGANGTGKSTLVGVFDFLKDCLKDNVRSALQKRGGFREVVSRGHENELIKIELKVQLDLISKSRTVTYSIEIGTKENQPNRPVVKREILAYRRGEYGIPFHFIDFREGAGEAAPETLANFDNVTDDTGIVRESQSLDSPDILAIKGLGQFKKFEAASQLRDLIENWSVSDFHITEARNTPEHGYAEHLSSSGDNLPLVTQYLQEHHPKIFANIIEKMSKRVPGVSEVLSETMDDGRTILRFKDGSFDTPFIAKAVSDGTIKMFAYLVLLHDPEPHPLLCVEEPENQLHPSLLQVLAEEFSSYAERRKGEGQVFVTTHSPDFLNAVPLDAIYWFEKENGYSTVKKAADDEQLVALYKEGDLPGALWRQGLFAEVG